MHKKKLLPFLLFVTHNLSLLAQAPIVEWQKCLGGSGYERTGSLIQLPDSNYLIMGATDSNDGNVTGNHGLQDAWLAKTDKYGNILWQKCYGGSYNDAVIRAIETFNNNLLLIGVTGSFDGDVSGNHSSFTHYDVWAIMVDNQGNILWQKCYGGSGDEFVYDAVEISDSSFILVGSTTSNDFDVSGNHSQDTSDVWTIKIDFSGNLIWQKCFGGNNVDVAYSICQAYNEGYIVIGSTMSNNGDINFLHDSIGNHEDIWLLRISSSGDLQWEKTIGGSAVDIGWDVQQDDGFSYTVLGHTASHDGDIINNHSLNYTFDVCMANIDSTGNLQWQKCYGGSASDFGYSFIKTNNGYLIAGETISIDGDVSGLHTQNGYDIWVLGIDSLRNLEWQKCLGGTESELFSSIIESSFEGYIISASTQSNNGDVSGHHNPNYASDFWILKISSPYVFVPEEPAKLLQMTSYFANKDYLIININTTIKEKVQLQLFDIAGKALIKKSLDLKLGENKYDLPISFLSNGVYYIQLQTSDKIFTNKVYH